MDRDPDDHLAHGEPSDGRRPEDVEDSGRPGPAIDPEGMLTDAALAQRDPGETALIPDDPVEGEAARRGADPDLAPEAGRGEEP